MVLWVGMTYSYMVGYQYFGGPYCLLHPEDGGSKVAQIGILHHYVTTHKTMTWIITTNISSCIFCIEYFDLVNEQNDGTTSRREGKRVWGKGAGVIRFESLFVIWWPYRLLRWEQCYSVYDPEYLYYKDTL